MFEADDGNFAQAQSPPRKYAAVAGEEVTVLISQNRNVEAKRFDAASDLLDLLLPMEPRVAGIKLEPLDCDMLDPKFAHHSAPPVERPSDLVP
jgi:hypothetical protein